VLDTLATEREPSSETRIRMRDCDAFGHVHNTRYLDYVMDAREDHLRTFYGFEFGPYAAKTNASWVVSSSHQRFYRPLHAGAMARILTRLIAVDDRKLTFEGRIYSARGELAYLAWVTVRHIDLTRGTGIDHPAEFLYFARPLLWELDGEPSFDERARELEPRRGVAA